MRSVARPVVCAEPWFMLVEVAASWTPSPTWIGLVPPRGGLTALAPLSIWLRVSWKIVVLPLNPMVLALAMLLPVTSSIVWLTRRPLMPAKSERSMGTAFRGAGCAGAASQRVAGGAGGRERVGPRVRPEWSRRRSWCRRRRGCRLRGGWGGGGGAGGSGERRVGEEGRIRWAPYQ